MTDFYCRLDSPLGDLRKEKGRRENIYFCLPHTHNNNNAQTYRERPAAAAAAACELLFTYVLYVSRPPDTQHTIWLRHNKLIIGNIEDIQSTFDVKVRLPF